MRYLSLLLVLLSSNVFGQFVQDASGKSTLKLDGNVLNIDITDARLSYWYQQTSTDQGRIANKLRVAQQELDSLQKINNPTPAQQGAIILAQENVDALDKKRQNMGNKSMRGNLIGFRVFAENGTGIANIFSAGFLAPKSGFDFTIGRFYTIESKAKEKLKKRLIQLGHKQLEVDKSREELNASGLRDPDYVKKSDALDREEEQIKRTININWYKLSQLNRTGFQITPYLNFESSVSSLLTTSALDSLKRIADLQKKSLFHLLEQ